MAALGALAIGLLVEVGRSLADDPQLQQAPSSANGSIVAITGQISRDTYGIYLVDLDNQTICVYQYLTSAKTLKLLATRTFAYDVQLDEYNTEPSPRQIRQMVTEHRRLIDEPIEPTEPAEPTDLPRPTGVVDPTEPDAPEVDLPETGPRE